MPEELKLLPCPACGGKAVFPINFEDVLIQIECRCGCSGSRELTEDNAITAWNSLPRALTWTTELPKEEGQYYWALFRNLRVGAVQVVRLQGELHALIAGSEDECPLSDFIQWAGPIPTPKEQKNV